MTIFQILAKIFGPKKKKTVKPIVVYTPPVPTGPTAPTGPKIDPLTGEIIKDKVVIAVDPNLAVYSKIVESLSILTGIAGRVTGLRNKHKLKLIQSNTSISDRFKFEAENKIIEANYQTEKEQIIYAIKLNCFQIETNYKLLTSFDLKTEVKSRYDNLKTIFDNYNFLPLTSYALIAPIKPITIVEGPILGGTQTNTPTTTTQAPVNDGTYPNWANQMYSPNTTVYYNGHLYNSLTTIEGTNNDAPDRDGRWRLIL